MISEDNLSLVENKSLLVNIALKRFKTKKEAAKALGCTTRYLYLFIDKNLPLLKGRLNDCTYYSDMPMRILNSKRGSNDKSIDK